MQRAYCPRCRVTVSPHISREFYARLLIRSYFFRATVLRHSSARYRRVWSVVKLRKTGRRESNLVFLIAITWIFPLFLSADKLWRMYYSIFFFFQFFPYLRLDSRSDIKSNLCGAMTKKSATSSNSQRSELVAKNEAEITTQAKSSVSGDDNPRVSMIDAINGRLFIKRNKRVREHDTGS